MSNKTKRTHSIQVRLNGEKSHLKKFSKMTKL